MESFKYMKLKDAIGDLLWELGIEPSELIKMSKGCNLLQCDSKVKLSQCVAKKLVDCGVGAVDEDEVHKHNYELKL